MLDQPIDEFEVFVYPSAGKPMVVPARADSTLRQIVTRGGAKPGEDIAVFIALDAHGNEGEADETAHEGVSLEKTCREFGITRGGRVIFSHCRWVQVTVNYQNESPHRQFRPSARIGRVLHWVITDGLHLKEEDFDVAKLRICDGAEVGTNVRLAELLTLPGCSLCFELILAPRVQG